MAPETGRPIRERQLSREPCHPSARFVHIHDISLPRRYPKVYFDQGLYWNEQYLLQAFLSFNSRFETIWPGNHLMLAHPTIMHAAFPEIAKMREKYPLAEPSSFWMRVRG